MEKGVDDLAVQSTEVLTKVALAPLTGEPTGFPAYTMLRLTYGDDVGYIYTDFTYPGELIGNAGETVVSVLDKIKSVLGNYEYFYDIDGNFRFQ